MFTLREVTRMTYRDALTALVGERAAREIWLKYPANALPAADLSALPHVGRALARRIEAALALGYWTTAQNEKPAIHSPEDAANLLMPQMSRLEQEELWVLLLNTRSRVLDALMVYRGSLNSAQVRVGEIFRDAVRRNAAAVIVAHNHPSGDPDPSPDDVAVTRAIVQAGTLLDVDVLDHIIIGGGRFVSLKERRLGF